MPVSFTKPSTTWTNGIYPDRLHMAFITIFTAPKPFVNPHIATIQRNAIRNWLSLSDVVVLLMGDESGMKEAAAETGVRHVAQVRANEKGTPLVSDMFAQARALSNSSLLMCANADMLFLPDILPAARLAVEQNHPFLIVGQRWDLDVTEPLDFDGDWAVRLENSVRREARLHIPAGSDYFIFPRHLYDDMPDFTIGRSGWDNWMIYHARRQGWMVIDATPAITAIHQSHDYSHLPGGLPHYDLEESQENIRLAGGAANLYTILDADRQMRDGKIGQPRPTLLRLLRQGEVSLTVPVMEGRAKSRIEIARAWAARRLRRLRRRIIGSL